MHVLCTPLEKSWAHAKFVGKIASLMEFVLKTRANSSASQYVASSQRSSPQAIPTASHPSTMSTLPSRSLPTEPSPSYFPRFPIGPRCPRFRLAPSQRSSPQATFYGFPSVHGVHASVSLPPNDLPKLFPRVSRPSALSSPSQRISPKLFPTVSRPSTCRRLLLAPSQQNSCDAISHDFPSIYRVVASSTLSLLPYCPPTAKETKREPKHRRCFWGKSETSNCRGLWHTIKDHIQRSYLIVYRT